MKLSPEQTKGYKTFLLALQEAGVKLAFARSASIYNDPEKQGLTFQPRFHKDQETALEALNSTQMFLDSFATMALQMISELLQDITTLQEPAVEARLVKLYKLFFAPAFGTSASDEEILHAILDTATPIQRQIESRGLNDLSLDDLMKLIYGPRITKIYERKALK